MSTEQASELLAAATDVRARVAAELDEADAAWRAALLGAVDAGVPVTHAARLAGVTRRRFYQVQGEARD